MAKKAAGNKDVGITSVIAPTPTPTKNLPETNSVAPTFAQVVIGKVFETYAEAEKEYHHCFDEHFNELGYGSEDEVPEPTKKHKNHNR